MKKWNKKHGFRLYSRQLYIEKNNGGINLFLVYNYEGFLTKTSESCSNKKVKKLKKQKRKCRNKKAKKKRACNVKFKEKITQCTF